MKDIRELQASGVETNLILIDDWISLEECNQMVWAFEYDGEPVLWGDMKRGEKHYPRKITDWLIDLGTRAGPYLFQVRDRIGEELIKEYNYPYLYSADGRLDAVIDSGIDGDSCSWWNYYTSILFLNDNFKGGEIIFDDQDILVTPRMGSLLFFPSSEKWRTELVDGGSYRMIGKYTDVAAQREDDPNHSRKPFGVHMPHQTQTDANPNRHLKAEADGAPPIPPSLPTREPKKKKKKKGCSGCVEARKHPGKKLVKIRNTKTGEVKEVWQTPEEMMAMKIPKDIAYKNMSKKTII